MAVERTDVGRGRKERKADYYFSHLHLLTFAFALRNLSFTQLNQVDPGAAGIPETMIKARESRDEKRVREEKEE